MAKQSKFKKGMNVKSILNEKEVYEVLNITKNDLIVKAKSNNLVFQCKKSLFEPLEVKEQ